MNTAIYSNTKQPKIFWFACATTLLERFSYYMLGYLLTLYAKNALHFSDHAAFALYAAYNGFVYLTPAIGGYLADNIMGIRRSMLTGLLLETLGLFCLSVPNEISFYIGLSLVVLGVGFFKTGPTNLMARAYAEKDPRIDSGFTLYYMMINVGSFFSPLAAGFLQQKYGWQVAFSGGAIIMCGNLLLYFLQQHSCKELESEAGKKTLGIQKNTLLFFGIVVSCVAFAFLTYRSEVANYFFIGVSTLVFLYFLFEIIRSPRDEKFKIIACLFLILTGFIFFLLYFQQFTSMTLFMDRCMSHDVLFLKNLPTMYFLTLNAFWVVVLSPPLAWLYTTLGKKGKDLAVTSKFPLGLLVSSLCFFLLAFSTRFVNEAGQVSSWWVIFAFMFYSLGELFISALGVAMVTHIAPKRMYGVMMGSWFLIACALASAVSGKVADFASIPSSVQDAHTMLPIYAQAFNKMGMIAVIATIVVFLCAPFVKRIANLK